MQPGLCVSKNLKDKMGKGLLQKEEKAGSSVKKKSEQGGAWHGFSTSSPNSFSSWIKRSQILFICHWKTIYYFIKWKIKKILEKISLIRYFFIFCAHTEKQIINCRTHSLALCQCIKIFIINMLLHIMRIGKSNKRKTDQGYEEVLTKTEMQIITNSLKKSFN